MPVFFDDGRDGVCRVVAASLVGISYDRNIFTGEREPWAVVKTPGGDYDHVRPCYASSDDAKRAANPLNLDMIYVLSGGEE